MMDTVRSFFYNGCLSYDDCVGLVAVSFNLEHICISDFSHSFLWVQI